MTDQLGPETLTEDELRRLFRRELQRARLAQRSEEAMAIEEGLENHVAQVVASLRKRLEEFSDENVTLRGDNIDLRKRLEETEEWAGDATFFLQSQVERQTEDRLEAAELLASLPPSESE